MTTETPRLNMSDWIVLILFAAFVFHQMSRYDFLVDIAMVYGVKLAIAIINSIFRGVMKGRADYAARNPRKA